MHHKMLLQIKPKPQPKYTRREVEHFHWPIKTPHSRNKTRVQQKISNSTIISKKAQQTDKRTKQQHEYKY